MRLQRDWCGAIVALAVLVVASAAIADDERPIRALIIDGQNNHKWMETTPVLVEILESTGCFEVEVATSPAKGEDLDEFRPKFNDFDVVVSNYNGALWSEATQDDLESFVEDGGGLVIVHAANNAFRSWPTYNRMIGLGGWGGRNETDGPYIRYREGKFVRDLQAGRGGSHGRRHAFVVDIRNADHPITKGIPTHWLHKTDELYDRLRGPAEELTVLATAYSNPTTGGTGEHEPVLMTIDFGDGRVFHTTLGHDTTAMSCVGFQTTLARGAEWAATGSVTIPIPSSDFPEANQTPLTPIRD